MSDTTRNKTVTFSGAAGFAVVRALRQRLEKLSARHGALMGYQDEHSREVRQYLHSQILDVHAALAVMGSTA